MTSIEYREQIYKVPIDRIRRDDNDENRGESESEVESECECEYILRGLRDDEVKPWSEFCASVFSYKAHPPPAEYFYRHYANDPTTKVPGSSRLIRVALWKGNIVASCRIFVKDISAGNRTASHWNDKEESKSQSLQVLRAGGIGEVCTDVNHRRRGISTALLKNAIAIMEDRSDLFISSLHAAPTFFPLYESLGYVAPPVSHPAGGSRWVTVDLCCGSSEPSTLGIRPAEFSDDAELLQRVHASYSEQRLAGCILRSPTYWKDYLSKELEGSLFVMTVESGLGLHDPILAWLSLKPWNRGGSEDEARLPSFCVQEFGIDMALLQTNESITMSDVMGALVAHAIRENPHHQGNPSDSIRCSLRLPGFVADDIRESSKESTQPFFDWTTESTEIDRGWMYRSLGKNGGSAVANEFLDFLQGTASEGGCKDPQREHFVWPSDSF